jgi:hypothetical protein
VAALFGVRALVTAPTGTGGRADILGALLVTGGVSLSVYVLLAIDAEPVRTAVLAITAAGLLAGFLVRQASTDTPLLPLRLLSTRNLGLGNLVQALMVAGRFGFQFLGVLYLQQLLGYSRCRRGWRSCPYPS